MSKNSPKGPAGAGQGQGQPNWWLAAIWALTAVLLFRTCSQTPPTGPQPSITDLRSNLIAQNAQMLEITAGKTFGDYSKQLNAQEDSLKDQLQKKKITAADFQTQVENINASRAEGSVLVADALLRAGEKTGHYDRFQDAFQTLYTLKQAQGEKPVWDKLQIQLPANDQLPARTVTPKQVYDKAEVELGEANRHNLVWGFIPGYQILDGLVHLTGAVPSFSYWFAALLLALLVRAAAYPFSQKQLMFSRQMAQLTPLVKEIQEKYKTNDAQKNEKTMALYAEYGINPLAGCFPTLVQLPFFLAIYQCMLQYRFDFQKGSFLWTTPSISAATHGFTAPNLGQPDNILILLYAASMLISTLLMPISDPANAKQQRITGIIVALLFPALMLSRAYPLPCAFVLYWTFTNVFTTLQTLRAHRLPTPPLVKKTTVVGGIIPQAPRKQGFWERLQEQAAAQLEERRKAEEKAQGEGPKSDEAKEKPSFDTDSIAKNGQPKTGPKSKPKRRT